MCQVDFALLAETERKKKECKNLDTYLKGE